MTQAIAPRQQSALAPQQQRYMTLKDLVLGRTKEIQSVAAKHLSPERLINIGLSLASRNAKILECTPASILSSLVECARLGLEPTGRIGGAYLVPFKNRKKEGTSWVTVVEAQILTAYQGEIDLACRTGLAQAVEARIVYEADLFEHREGDKPRLIHRPAKGDRGKELLVYARALLPSGAYTCEVLYPADIEARRNKSRAKDNGPWVTDYWAMAKKSAIRAVANRLPKSAGFYESALARAYVAHQAEEERVEYGLDLEQAVEVLGVSEEVPEPAMPEASTDRLASKLEAKAAKLDANAEVEELGVFAPRTREPGED